MLSDYCRKRIAPLLPPREVEQLRTYLLALLEAGVLPPSRGSGFEWQQLPAARLEEALRAELSPQRPAALGPPLRETSQNWTSP